MSAGLSVALAAYGIDPTAFVSVASRLDALRRWAEPAIAGQLVTAAQRNTAMAVIAAMSDEIGAAPDSRFPYGLQPGPNGRPLIVLGGGGFHAGDIPWGAPGVTASAGAAIPSGDVAITTEERRAAYETLQAVLYALRLEPSQVVLDAPTPAPAGSVQAFIALGIVLAAGFGAWTVYCRSRQSVDIEASRARAAAETEQVRIRENGQNARTAALAAGQSADLAARLAHRQATGVLVPPTPREQQTLLLPTGTPQPGQATPSADDWKRDLSKQATSMLVWGGLGITGILAGTVTLDRLLSRRFGGPAISPLAPYAMVRGW